jgi:translation initiation factor IF-1
LEVFVAQKKKKVYKKAKASTPNKDTRDRDREPRVEETSSDVIRAEGVVLDARPNTTFMVKLDAGPEILAHVGGKLRRNYIRILPGDRVVLEISTYDPEKGRIVYRK